ncbi:helix-turn-helix domain-containing protein [Modestobacter roseus]|uniref:Regulatory Fis family protein n=1 Tax=Modestobacter roseus TaxID=1181884 RepID=A0A562IV90_9ACTN|nr:helix-turn-helix domain-containing protein [Modestobacter roseus]MQA32952.1 Fis family transcriptional regulator [Modestobacter roseus]TWH74595.1 regulatory Fis family protein [Modestobacter roseus]
MPAGPAVPVPATVPPAAVAPSSPARVRASWQRSERYGVTPEEVVPVYADGVPTDSLFYECGAEVVRALHGTLAGEPVGFMLTDPQGLVLGRWCDDPAINRSLDRVHLAPGFYFGEQTAGTNGLGLALADRVPTLVRGDEHYVAPLRRYTCAAVPVLDPRGGGLVGSINLTTWSQASSDLLLALAQAAAGNTTALMQVRAGGGAPLPPTRGTVFHVLAGQCPAGDADPCTSAGWRAAVASVRTAVAAGRVVAVVGEPGAGRATAASLARRAAGLRERVLVARPPAAEDVAGWLALWSPELRAPDTCVVLGDADALPAWAAEQLAADVAAAGRPPGAPSPLVVTAAGYTALPEALRTLVDAVVEVPPLRHRPDDVEPLARALAAQLRHREVEFTPRALRTLRAHAWPGNVRELRAAVRDAAARTDVVDVQHLPPGVLSEAARPLTRLEQLERDEMVRCLTRPGTTVGRAAAELGLSRATLYRKIAQYRISV